MGERKLRDAMEALSGARTLQDIANVTVEIGRDAVSASAATVWLIDPQDGFLKVAASHNVDEDTLAAYRVVRMDSRLPVARVVATRTPMFIADEQELAREAPAFYLQAANAGRVQPFAVLPLATDERALGAISFSFVGASHPFASEEREFLLGLARTCEQAFERARLLAVEAEARRLAEAASLRKDEFIAMLGHELRNPLAAMTSALDLIKLREGTLSRELVILDRHLHTLVHMVSDLLDVSRLTLAKIQLDRSTCELAAAVRDVVDGLQSKIQARQHALTVEIPRDLRVNADLERLLQVLENLVTNAIMYTPDGGRIDVRAYDEGDDARIEVSDTGVGIPPELIATVFDAFVQGPRAIDRTPGGLGLGLTLVKQLVELHGGRVSAHSEGAGRGSVFVVHWPKASGTRTTDKMAKLTKPDPLRVLVVDHEVETSHAFARALEGMGHSVVLVHDANNALAVAAGFAAEIVFVDLAVGGYEMARQLRTLPTLQAARIVTLGPHHAHDAVRASAVGVAHHAAKPIDLVALATLLS